MQDLTIIITTSPIPSNPSLQVIDKAISSIFIQPSLNEVPIYIICDGVKVKKDAPSAYKSGIVSEKSLHDYQTFKCNLAFKYSVHPRITIQQRTERYCFAQNIKHVMHKIHSPFVLIFQHDHMFVREVNFHPILNALRHSSQINYIGIMNKSVSTIPIQLSQHLPLREYFSQQMHYNQPYTQESFCSKLREHYIKLYGIPLVPLIYWYDKVHVARKSYYLETVFNEKGYYDEVLKQWGKTVSFVEDSFGNYMRRNIQKTPKLHSDLGAYIFWDEDDSAIVHIHGRAFITQEERQLLYTKQKPNKIKQQTEINYYAPFQENQ